jgi:hypothetical protein
MTNLSLKIKIKGYSAQEDFSITKISSEGGNKNLSETGILFPTVVAEQPKFMLRSKNNINDAAHKTKSSN